MRLCVAGKVRSIFVRRPHESWARVDLRQLLIMQGRSSLAFPMRTSSSCERLKAIASFPACADVQAASGSEYNTYFFDSRAKELYL